MQSRKKWKRSDSSDSDYDSVPSENQPQTVKMTCYANYRVAKAKILLRAHHQLKQVQTKIFAFRRLFPY